MAKPLIHATNSVKRFGGRPEDYQAIHDFIDCTKAALSDMRHRACLHNTMGPFIAERVFGLTVKNSDGKNISVRDVAEQHIIDDLGFIPTLEKWFEKMPEEPWMMGIRTKKLQIVD